MNDPAERTRGRLLFLMVTLVAVAHAQDPKPPSPPPITVRVLGPDGQALPGVPLCISSPSKQPVLDDDGWLIVEREEVQRLRDARYLTTNPDGEATLASLADVGALRVAEPFFPTSSTVILGREVTLRVDKREPVGVRVFDGDGAPLPHFPVALHADGRDMAIALTDKLGRAVLGLPAGFEARAVVAPAGWVGPRDPFPSVADTLPGSRRVTLNVPPHGSLILRAVRSGTPARTDWTAMGFHRPNDYFPLSPEFGVRAQDVTGIRYPAVALGIALGCYSPLSSHAGGLLECEGPARPGEARVVDIELGPLLQFDVDTGTERHDLAVLRVRVVTDEGELVGYANRESGDRWTFDPRRAVAGKVLRRIDLDGNVGLADRVPLSGTRLCDHALTAASIAIGTVTIAAVGPQLRGIVTDAAGNPVVGAQVQVSPVPESNTGNQFVTGADGRFLTAALPIARDDAGTPIELFAQARHQGATSAFQQGVDGEVVLVLAATAARSSQGAVRNGRVVAHLRNLATANLTRFDVRLVARHGEFLPTRLAGAPEGAAVAEFEDLREGLYSLYVPGPERYAVAVLRDLAVPDDGACADPRLADIDCGRAWRRVTLRILDGDGIPIAGARWTAPRLSLRSDGKGEFGVWIGRDPGYRAVVAAPGWRSAVVTDWPDAQEIRLEPPGTLAVAVQGLPADVPRERLEVWLRDVDHDAFGGPRGTLVADGSDTVTLELPARGRYRPTLWVKYESAAGRSGSARVVDGNEPAVTIDEPPSEPIAIRLEPADVERLRELLAK